jgi:hypothetical protein
MESALRTLFRTLIWSMSADRSDASRVRVLTDWRHKTSQIGGLNTFPIRRAK